MALAATVARGFDMSFGFCVDCDHCRSPYGDLAKDCVKEASLDDLESLDLACMRHPPKATVVDDKEGHRKVKYLWPSLNGHCVGFKKIGCGEFEKAKGGLYAIHRK